MTQITPPNDAAEIARAALRRRISTGAARRFVANARRALPRDGTLARDSARRFVARLAWDARRAGKRLAGVTGNFSAEDPATSPGPPPRHLRRRFPAAIKLLPYSMMNLRSIPTSVSRPALRRKASSLVPFTKSPVRSAASRSPATLNFRATPGLRLGHVHVKVRELERSLPFYRDLLGLRLTERAGRFAFLAFGTEHHAIALEEIGSWSSRPSRRAVGVAHIALEAPDVDAFAALRRKLLASGVPIISRNNGISWTMRFRDPDGNELEIYIDRRHFPAGSALWGGRWRMPFRLEDEPAAAPLTAAS